MKSQKQLEDGWRQIIMERDQECVELRSRLLQEFVRSLAPKGASSEQLGAFMVKVTEVFIEPLIYAAKRYGASDLCVHAEDDMVPKNERTHAERMRDAESDMCGDDE